MSTTTPAPADTNPTGAPRQATPSATRAFIRSFGTHRLADIPVAAVCVFLVGLQLAQFALHILGFSAVWFSTGSVLFAPLAAVIVLTWRWAARVGQCVERQAQATVAQSSSSLALAVSMVIILAVTFVQVFFTPRGI